MFPRLPALTTFVADANFVSGTQKTFLILFRNILCPQQMFPSLRSMETQHSFCVPRVCAPKKHHEQQCVRNNVSSFSNTFKSNTWTYQLCLCLTTLLFFLVDKPSSTRLTTDKVNAAVSGNGRIALSCVTDASPPPSQYQFYRDGVYLRTSLTGIHVIQKARYYDAGTYLCVPLNSLGAGTNGSVQVVVSGE